MSFYSGDPADVTTWIHALRSSHNRFAALVSPLDATAVQRPSYDTEWSIAQVASHLGSQAEIFGLFLDAGASGGDAPGPERFGPIWDRWNALAPAQQVAESLAANGRFVARVQGLGAAERDSFALAAFGRQVDLGGLLAMRLGEHAVHTWDVAVALDPAAVLAPDATALLVDTLPELAARTGKAGEPAAELSVGTDDPARRFRLSLGEQVTLSSDDAPGAADLRLPAEAFVRLCYGRLDPQHTPPGVEGGALLTRLREVFPGF